MATPGKLAGLRPGDQFQCSGNYALRFEVTRIKNTVGIVDTQQVNDHLQIKAGTTKGRFLELRHLDTDVISWVDGLTGDWYADEGFKRQPEVISNNVLMYP